MYKATIGLEVHAELDTESKLFCGCKNNPDEKRPNINICPVCMGYPGALPYINKEAIENILIFGIAIDGKIADFSEFDRKHYFYPDIPKGYQISQYDNPLIKGGKILKIDIERVHLEEDTGKNIHSGDSTLIDFNRSGVPLMELVTKPQIHSSKEAVKFAEELQLIFRYTGIGRARMEWGEMRLEANISVSKGKKLGTKVEVKNLNSFKALEGAIEYEIKRQKDLLEKGESVTQETRGWNENREITFSQRSKEDSQEYRYMPEPDLPKFFISEVEGWDKKSLRKKITSLPKDKRKEYSKRKIQDEQIGVLLKNRELANLFEETIEYTKGKNARLTSNYITSDILGYSKTNKDKVKKLTGEMIGKVVTMVSDEKISSRGAKDLLNILIEKGGNPEQIAKENNIYQISDENELSKVIKRVIDNNRDIVKEVENGEDKMIKFLIGQVMKETNGSANPQVTERLIKKILL